MRCSVSRLTGVDISLRRCASFSLRDFVLTSNFARSLRYNRSNVRDENKPPDASSFIGKFIVLQTNPASCQNKRRDNFFPASNNVRKFLRRSVYNAIVEQIQKTKKLRKHRGISPRQKIRKIARRSLSLSFSLRHILISSCARAQLRRRRENKSDGSASSSGDAACAELPNGPGLRRVQRVRLEAHVLFLSLQRRFSMSSRWFFTRAFRHRSNHQDARTAHFGRPGRQRFARYKGSTAAYTRSNQRQCLP